MLNRYASLLAVTCLISTPAIAIPVNIEMLGEFTSVSDDLKPVLDVGHTFRMTFGYDTDATDSNADPEMGDYRASIGTLTFTDLVSGYSGTYEDASIWVNSTLESSHVQFYSATGIGGGIFPTINGTDFWGIHSALFTVNPLSSDSMPTDLNIEDFRPWARVFAMHFEENNNIRSATGTITSVSVNRTSVPDSSSTLLLLSTALSCLSVAARRGRSSLSTQRIARAESAA